MTYCDISGFVCIFGRIFGRIFGYIFVLGFVLLVSGCSDAGHVEGLRAGSGGGVGSGGRADAAAVDSASFGDSGDSGDSVSGDAENLDADGAPFVVSSRATVAPLPAALALASDEILLEEPEGLSLALLVPLSGDSAWLGGSIVDAVAIAVSDHSRSLEGGALLSLRVFDSGETRGSAQAAARDALAAGAGLVLGPLYADAAAAAGEILTPEGVSLLSFSNDSRVSRQGVFILGQTPQSQLAAVIQHALDSGVRDFGIFAPGTALGVLSRDVLRAYRDEGLVRIGGEGLYPGESLVPDEEVRRFLQTARDYEALILPASGQALQGVVNSFAFHDPFIDGVQLLGLASLEDETLRGEPALHGAWFAAPPLATRAQFSDRFEGIMGYRPPLVASLAYDAAAVAILLHRSWEGSLESSGATGSPGSPWSVSALTRAEGFFGTGGLFRLRRDGVSERALAIYELTAGGLRERAVAPRRFSAPDSN
ncbi:MAG: penicillin-binding protein activator [Alphaproteobacteria bacterium]